jgi:pyruvate, water dikinase
MSPVAVDSSQIEGRVPHFMERAGYYFENWDRLLENWKRKVRSTIADLEAIAFKPLPPVVPIEDITGGVGLDPTFEMLAKGTSSPKASARTGNSPTSATCMRIT